MTLTELSLVLLPLMGLVLGLAVGLDHSGWAWLVGALLGAAVGVLLHFAIRLGLGFAVRGRKGPP